MKHKSYPIHEFKSLDDAQGVFEAIVAVFNNVDHVGDKIIPGAFQKSLEQWEERGRPIPVIFSHQWGNLDSHIGEVLEAKETETGLYVKAQLEMDEDFAARVWKKMRKGTLAEFSFAYDVINSKLVNGINELRELEIFEVGPTLKGANPETELIDVKGAKDGTSDDAKETEGQTQTGEPSGPPPRVVLAQIDIQLLEE